MAGFQNFRSALSGFNREDVVRYIEYINNKHKTELEQLNNQLQAVRQELSRAKGEDTSAIKQQLAEAQERCAQLEAQLAQASQQKQEAAQPQVQEKSCDELEAYRRAERAERLAKDRAAQIYAQANAALAEATVKVEAASDELAAVAEQMAEKVQLTKKQLQDAATAMYAIRPEEE